jgi:hypothetical protein
MLITPNAQWMPRCIGNTTCNAHRVGKRVAMDQKELLLKKTSEQFPAFPQVCTHTTQKE